MTRLTDQLREYGAYLDTLEVAPVPRTPRHRVALLAAAVVAVLVVAAGLFAALDGGGSTGRVQVPRTTPPSPPTSLAPVTESPTTTTTPVVERPLTSESRLGYAGLGSLKLGASVSEAERVANVTLVNDGCGWSVHAGSDKALFGVEALLAGVTSSEDLSGATIAQISVNTSALFTISGIHVGSTKDDVLRTYPGAVEDQGNVSINSSDGRTIEFFIGREDAVVGMRLFFTGRPIDIDPRC